MGGVSVEMLGNQGLGVSEMSGGFSATKIALPYVLPTMVRAKYIHMSTFVEIALLSLTILENVNVR